MKSTASIDQEHTTFLFSIVCKEKSAQIKNKIYFNITPMSSRKKQITALISLLQRSIDRNPDYSMNAHKHAAFENSQRK
ncbi:MAG: hypothetical protein JSR39_08255 [Verrucomicrobia bacterium]|nr:hypothetical protein [Verrucomicrobiota bacterium]